MKLQTTRLDFRKVTKGDLNNIHALHSFNETDRFNTLGIPKTIEATEKIIDDWCYKQNAEPPSLYVFCLELIDTQEFIGLIGLNLGKTNYKTAEVWYKILPDHWRKGYATEALTCILNFAFNDLQLHRIEAGCAVENTASIKVLEKAGMIKEGLKRKILPIRGEWKDNYFYAILEEDFFTLQDKAQRDLDT